MKKTLLVILIIAAVAFSAFADGFHYGIEADVDYSFIISDEHEGDNKATFKFKPYVYNDFFTVRLLAEWKPDETGAHGFDYLMEFDTTDMYTISASALKYIDEISFKTQTVDFVLGKGSRAFDVLYQFESLNKNRAQLKADFGVVKLDLYSTDFEKTEYLGLPDDYISMQYADVKVNLGLVEIEASAARHSYYLEYNADPTTWFVGYNRIIPKVGTKLQFGVANVGFYFMTDTCFDKNDNVLVKLLDRWVLEAVANFKVNTFDLTGTFYLDNTLEGYSNVYLPEEALFGFRAEANLNLRDFFSLNIKGDLPLKLNDGLGVVRYFGKTMESLSASVEIGTWWKVGAEISVRGLISQIEDGDSIKQIIKKAEPTLTAGIYTTPLDVTASVKFTTTYTGFTPEVTVGAVIRGDNFLSYTK